MKKILLIVLMLPIIYGFDTHNGSNGPAYTEWITHFKNYTGVQTGPPKQFNIFAVQHNWELKLKGGTITNFNAKLQTKGGSRDWYTLDTYSTTTPTSRLGFVNSQPVDVTRIKIVTFTGGSTIDAYSQHGGR